MTMVALPTQAEAKTLGSSEFKRNFESLTDARSTRTMPPKIVYGRKKTTTQTTTNFSKFISVEKNGVAIQQMGQSVVTVGGDDWRQQLEVAAETKAGGNILEGLEKGLEDLRLEQPQTQDVIKTRRKHKLRKAAKDPDAAQTGENKTPEDSGQEIEASTTGRSREIPKEMAVLRSQKGKRREPLKDHDAKTPADIKVRVLDPGSIKGERRQRIQLSQSSPTRTRPNRSSPSQKPSLPTTQPTQEPDNYYSNYASALLSMTGTGRIQPFDEWSTELEKILDITKIAEASFSEVYRLSAHGSSGTSNEESVLKLVALKPPPDIPLLRQPKTRTVRERPGHFATEKAKRQVKDMWKSEVDNVVSEVKLLLNLAHIPGFTNFRDLTVLQGRPTPFFSKAWKTWNNSKARKNKSEFPDPSKKTSYEETQLWAVIEMQDAGTDCEKLMESDGLRSIWEIWDVFWGVCLSVAKAEETYKFEHRDLHMGNICVQSRTEGDVVDITVQDPTRRKFRFTCLETTVIDYTLSRADVFESSSWQSSSMFGRTIDPSSSVLDSNSVNVAYLDLDQDPSLFAGDATEEYQYQIYRYMRSVALYNDPLQNSTPELASEPHRSPRKNIHTRFDSNSSIIQPGAIGHVWSQFHPKTNLVWTHFLLHKLLAHLDASAKTPEKLSTKQIMANVADKDDEPLKVKKKALKLHRVLKKVSELLCPVALGKAESLGSVKDLVLLAIDERWLRTEDVVA